MTQDQIIEWAKVAGVEDAHFVAPHPGVISQLTRFAALVAAHEREQCALVCERLGMATNGMYERNHECAAAIRARGEKPEPPHGWSPERHAQYMKDVEAAGGEP